jgi:hypothetical protein
MSFLCHVIVVVVIVVVAVVAVVAGVAVILIVVVAVVVLSHLLTITFSFVQWPRMGFMGSEFWHFLCLEVEIMFLLLNGLPNGHRLPFKGLHEASGP